MCGQRRWCQLITLTYLVQEIMPEMRRLTRVNTSSAIGFLATRQRPLFIPPPHGKDATYPSPFPKSQQLNFYSVGCSALQQRKRKANCISLALCEGNPLYFKGCAVHWKQRWVSGWTEYETVTFSEPVLEKKHLWELMGYCGSTCVMRLPICSFLQTAINWD